MHQHIFPLKMTISGQNKSCSPFQIRFVSGRLLDNLLELAPSVNRLATNAKKQQQQNRASEASLAARDPDPSRLSPLACFSYPYKTQRKMTPSSNVYIVAVVWDDILSNLSDNSRIQIWSDVLQIDWSTKLIKNTEIHSLLSVNIFD